LGQSQCLDVRLSEAGLIVGNIGKAQCSPPLFGDLIGHTGLGGDLRSGQMGHFAEQIRRYRRDEDSRIKGGTVAVGGLVCRRVHQPVLASRRSAVLDLRASATRGISSDSQATCSASKVSACTGDCVITEAVRKRLLTMATSPMISPGPSLATSSWSRVIETSPSRR